MIAIIQIDPVDFAKRLLNWTRHGYPELGDKGGMGIGKTTSTVVSHPRYLANPHEVSLTGWNMYQNCQGTSTFTVCLIDCQYGGTHTVKFRAVASAGVGDGR